MKDEEVGELWAAIQISPLWGAQPVAALIRKLVEERAHSRKYTMGNKSKEWTYLNLALRDFHIDPETWPEEWR